MYKKLIGDFSRVTQPSLDLSAWPLVTKVQWTKYSCCVVVKSLRAGGNNPCSLSQGVIWVISESECGVIVSPSPHQQPSPRNKDIKACVCVSVCRRATDRIYSALTSVISRLIRHGPKVPGRFPSDEWCPKGKGGRALLSSCSPSLPLRLFSLLSLWYFYLESPFPTSFKISFSPCTVMWYGAVACGFLNLIKRKW